MEIGIISDTHDRLDMIDQAITVFNKAKVELVVHAGDFISPFSSARFEELHCPLIGVFGNNDGDHRNLTKEFESFGAKVYDIIAQVRVDRKNIVVLHGHREELLQTMIQSKVFDLVISGHTHTFWLKEIEGIKVLNPGECCGYLTGKCTIAFFDTRSGQVRRVDLRSTSR